MDINQILKKTWHFIWESNSVLSWIVCIILAFVIIKFLVYPGIGFAFQTSHPIVAVVSSSMEHNEPLFDDWWNSKAICGNHQCTQKDFYSQYNISKSDFLNFRFRNGFNKGDIIFLFGTSAKKINKGDIIVFKSMKKDPIIHRVVNKWQENEKYYFRTKGDNNLKSVTTAWLDESRISQDKLIGRGVLKVPFLGWIKIGFVNLIHLFL